MVSEIAKVRIDGWKNQAELYLKEGKQVFIKNFNNDFFFGDIILIGDEYLTIYCDAPEKRIGNQTIAWVSIMTFDERRAE